MSKLERLLVGGVATWVLSESVVTDLASGEARFAAFELALVVGFVSAFGGACTLFCGALGSAVCAPVCSVGRVVLFVGDLGREDKNSPPTPQRGALRRLC